MRARVHVRSATDYIAIFTDTVGGAEMSSDAFQNRLPRAGMCCPRRCSPSNSPLVPRPIRRPHRVLSILPLPRTPYALQDAAPAKCVEEVVF